MKLTDVIRKPLITEKTTVMREDSQTLVFQVAMDANKIDIRRAVEQLLGAKVASVRTALAHGKEKRQGRFHDFRDLDHGRLCLLAMKSQTLSGHFRYSCQLVHRLVCVLP